MCLVWGAEQWANGYRVIANRKIQPRQEDAGAQAAQRCSPHKVVSFLLFNSCNFCSSLPLKAVVSLSFCVKKKRHIWFPLRSIFIPVWERVCRLLAARRTYSNALCVMDEDRALIWGCICDFFMTSPELLCRGLRPLTSLGLVHILATPSPLSFGDGPYPPLFRLIDHASLQNGPFGS